MLPESGAILYYLAEDMPYLPGEKLQRAQILRWMFFEQYSLLLNLSRPRLWRMWGVEMTAALGGETLLGPEVGSTLGSDVPEESP